MPLIVGQSPSAPGASAPVDETLSELSGFALQCGQITWLTSNASDAETSLDVENGSEQAQQPERSHDGTGTIGAT